MRIPFYKGVGALKFTLMLHFEFVAQAVPHQCIAHHGAEHRAAAAAEKTTADASPSRLWIQSYPGKRKGAVRLGNGNESDSSAPTIRLATLIRGARTAAGGERARILGVGASTAASTPSDILGSARGRHLICARAHLLRRAPQLATT